LLLAAQDGTAQSPAAKDPPAEAKPASAAKPETSEEDYQRIFGVIPNYKTINAPQPPISSKEKFKLAVHYFDPYTYAFVGVLAGLEQWRDAKPAYGQDTKGYLKWYGADFTDGFTNEFFVVWVVPSILREDPRYFRKGEGGFLSRTAYSLSRIVITRTDSGHQRFNFSDRWAIWLPEQSPAPTIPKKSEALATYWFAWAHSAGTTRCSICSKSFTPTFAISCDTSRTLPSRRSIHS
jgi:hypothetical protein